MKKKIVILIIMLLLKNVIVLLAQPSYNINQYHNQIISACTGFLYDSGGPNGNYSNNENYVVTICSATNDPLYIVFTNVSLESNYDYLYVYNGIGTTAPLIGQYTGSNNFTVSSNNATNCLTIRFRSDGSTTYSGFKGTINCGSVPNIASTGDCAGAIPVNCQGLVYYENDITSGYGNIQELNSSNHGCLVSNEHNTRWYTFNVQQGGTFTFAINSPADYDWALYNLTGRTCQDIINGTVPMIRCNYSADYGLTGCNLTSTIISGSASDPPWCKYVDVQAGQTWVLLVDKYSSGAHSYSLDFTYGGGTANIGVDNIPPRVNSISPISCGGNTITVYFSELVSCNSIQPSDFTITGPGGTAYSIATTTCTSTPSTQSAVLQINQPITVSGTFYLNFVGSINDLCGNAAHDTSFAFNINGVQTSITNVVHEICNQRNGKATVTATGGSGSYTYTWSTTPVQNTPTATGLSQGTYTVTVMDGNGCSSVSTVTIQNQGTIPSTTFTPQNPTICNGQSILVTLAQGNTYNWSPTNSIVSMSNDGDSVLLSPSQSTIYTITITDIYGCSSDTTLTVTVNQNPVVSLPSSLQKCESETLRVNLPTGYQYVWSPNYGLIQYGNDSVLITTPTSQIYSITVVNSHNCQSTYQLTVNVTPNPVITVTPNQTICPGAPTPLTASGATNYYWSPATYLSSTTGQTVYASPTDPITYTVYGVNSSGCRSNPVTVSLSIYPPLGSQIQTSGGITEICLGESVYITCFGNGGNGGPYYYTWSHGIGQATGPVQVSPNQTTTYTVTVSDNCMPPITDTITIYLKEAPQISITANPKTGCKPLRVNFTANINPAPVNILWDFGDPTSLNYNNSNAISPLHLYDKEGRYDIKLFAQAINGCNNTVLLEDFITVYPVPIAEFSWSPERANELEPLVNFSNLSVGGDVYYWYFGDTLSSNIPYSFEANPYYYYTYPGIYNVTLTVTNIYNCSDSVSHDIFVDPYYVFYFPSAFTPNGDGVNDKIGPKGNYFPNEYSFRVYTRWGELVFYTNDHNLQWDGRTSEGKLVPVGTYIYEISFRNSRNDLVYYNGYFLVLY